ncbi:hypothetical protein C8Q75DRAFT_803828 [Abortiporus biennis]|nr:hypothetical protein C8Q75DRAFT_803828 [Abortiporus biennis]
MAPSPQCAALAAAMQKKGYSYSDVAQKLGTSTQHVESICTGASHPSQQEFKALADALGITTPLPHDGAHQAK